MHLLETPMSEDLIIINLSLFGSLFLSIIISEIFIL